jgi:hypothetical protein
MAFGVKLKTLLEQGGCHRVTLGASIRNRRVQHNSETRLSQLPPPMKAIKSTLFRRENLCRNTRPNSENSFIAEKVYDMFNSCKFRHPFWTKFWLTQAGFLKSGRPSDSVSDCSIGCMLRNGNVIDKVSRKNLHKRESQSFVNSQSKSEASAQFRANSIRITVIHFLQDGGGVDSP